MIKMVILGIVLWVGLNFEPNEPPPKFVYEVTAQNGGKKGFNDTRCYCNPLTSEYKYILSKPGYTKRLHCCLSDFPSDVQKLILLCDSVADSGTRMKGKFKRGNYSAEFEIKDKYNYLYAVHE